MSLYTNSLTIYFSSCITYTASNSCRGIFKSCRGIKTHVTYTSTPARIQTLVVVNINSCRDRYTLIQVVT